MGPFNGLGRAKFEPAQLVHCSASADRLRLRIAAGAGASTKLKDQEILRQTYPHLLSQALVLQTRDAKMT